MNKETLVELVVGSRLWGTDYSGSDTERFRVMMPDKGKTLLGYKPLSLCSQTEEGTIWTVDALHFHNGIKKLSPDYISYLWHMRHSSDNEWYNKYINNVLEHLIECPHEVNVKYLYASQSRIKKLLNADKVGAKEALNLLFYSLQFFGVHYKGDWHDFTTLPACLADLYVKGNKDDYYFNQNTVSHFKKSREKDSSADMRKVLYVLNLAEEIVGMDIKGYINKHKSSKKVDKEILDSHYIDFIM